MIAYKGFHVDLTCTLGNGKFQYEEGIWIDEKKANCRQNGLHAAENPLDCLSYYPHWDKSVYYEVEAEGDIDEDGGDSKISCTRMRLLRKLDMENFVMAAVEYVLNHPSRKIKQRPDGKIRYFLERGTAEDGGAVIVQGKTPMAAGPAGSLVALIRMHPDGNVEKICIQRIDGKRYKADTWYRI